MLKYLMLAAALGGFALYKKWRSGTLAADRWFSDVRSRAEAWRSRAPWIVAGLACLVCLMMARDRPTASEPLHAGTPGGSRAAGEPSVPEPDPVAEAETPAPEEFAPEETATGSLPAFTPVASEDEPPAPPPPVAEEPRGRLDLLLPDVPRPPRPAGYRPGAEVLWQKAVLAPTGPEPVTGRFLLDEEGERIVVVSDDPNHAPLDREAFALALDLGTGALRWVSRVAGSHAALLPAGDVAVLTRDRSGALTGLTTLEGESSITLHDTVLTASVEHAVVTGDGMLALLHSGPDSVPEDVLRGLRRYNEEPTRREMFRAALPEAGLRTIQRIRLPAPVLVAAPLGDARRFLTAGPDGRVDVWSARHIYSTNDTYSSRYTRPLDEPESTYVGHADAVLCLRPLAYGRGPWRVISASRDGGVHLWATDEAAPLFQTTLEPSTAIDVARNGRYALSGDAEGTVTLWDLGSRTPLETFSGHGSPVAQVAFAQGWRRAVSLSEDGTLSLINLPTLE